MKQRPLIVFDGDDTLWRTEGLYDDARSACRRIAEHHGLDGEAWEQRQREVDLTRATDHGVAISRFPTSCAIATRLEAARQGVRLARATGLLISLTAARVFLERAPLVPGITDVLANLSDTCDLTLLTRGSPLVQARRLRQSNLGDLFETVSYVPTKTPDAFKSALDGRRPDACLSVGNSVPSDINPALAIGMSALWLSHGEAWPYEERERVTGPVHGRLLMETDCLTDVPLYVEKWLSASAGLAA